VEHGDLLMTLLVPENHGLRPGSAVIFRGVQTGDVRTVALAEDGTHIELRLRIAHRFRQTITDKTSFWVARPYVSGALFSGFTLSDVSALLTPYVSYYSEPNQGVPVEDGYRAAATSTRPDVKVSEVPAKALQKSQAKPPPPAERLVLVHVVYAAVEVDTFSPDDPIRREGTGVLFLDRAGRAVVVTARSLVDGNYTEQDFLGGRPEIAREQIKVAVPGGPVYRAGRNWVDPKGLDLALLVLEGVPPDLQTSPATTLHFDTPPDKQLPVELRFARADGDAEAEPFSWSAPLPDLAGRRGAALMQQGHVVALVGQQGGHVQKPAIVPIASVPDDLRPGQ
jgi:MlaD protein